MAELKDIDGEDDYVPLGQVPREWCDTRLLGTCRADGNYADIYAVRSVGHLRQSLAAECLDLGFEDLDVAVLQEGKPRRLSQLASREVFKTGLQGIYYRSRYGHDLENWALFEPFQIRITEEPTAIILNDPDLVRACQIFGLIIE